ncbi:MAG: methyltransferase domain-containing protein [Puniceicoccaceae bacterium]
MDAGQGIETSRSNWVFDEKVAPKFDEHVRKSVPDYDRIQDLAASLSDWFVKDGGTVVDLGASTGETLHRIQKRNPAKKIEVIGYDNSSAMIQQAKAKGVDVHFCDLSMLTEMRGHDYGVSLYTLQFLRPGAKQTVLSVCYDSLKRGGGFFVVEKVHGSIPEFQDITQQLYWEMKLENGLTPKEVLNKAAALRGNMFPMTVAENEALFRRVGFVRYELVYRHLQFAGWLLMK